MKDLFVDANILIDLLSSREPFSTDAATLFDLAENGKVKLHIAAISVNIVYYVLRQSYGHKKTIEFLNDLVGLVKIIDVNKSVIKDALASGNSDFEDAIQYYSAISNHDIKAIISRDKKGFKKSDISVFTAAEVLQLLLK